MNMPVPRWFSPRRLSPAHQAVLVVKAFPVFDWEVRGSQCVLRGDLQPSDSSDTYHVNIQYRPDGTPFVFVSGLETAEYLPHSYSNRALCLYHPGIFDWHGRRTLMNYIVPWTASWLFFYEKWKELGVWLGPKVPHSPTSS